MSSVAHFTPPPLKKVASYGELHMTDLADPRIKILINQLLEIHSIIKHDGIYVDNESIENTLRNMNISNEDISRGYVS